MLCNFIVFTRSKGTSMGGGDLCFYFIFILVNLTAFSFFFFFSNTLSFGMGNHLSAGL